MSGTTTTDTPLVGAVPAEPPLEGPTRPRGVPSGAIWEAPENEWRLSDTDAEGRPHGPYRSWRADGSVWTVCTFEHGKESGPVWKFHPDGSLFSLGCFAEGAARGVHRRYANDDPRAERLQSCCVPDGAWQLRQDYSVMNSVETGWFNRAGRRLLASGALYPERPRGVPANAWYTEDTQTWESGVVWGEKGFNGTRMRWSNRGISRLVENLREGKRHGLMQSFDDDGALLWEAHFDDGRLSGAFRMATVAPGHFADERVRGQRGAFLDDQAVERWHLLDHQGATLEERDLGVPLDAAAMATSPVLEGHQQPAAAWRVLARQLFAQRRVGEGLVSAARAVARAGVAADLLDALSQHTMLLGQDEARGEAAQAVERSTANPVDAPVILIDALKRGGEASTLLWELAKALPDHEQASLDLLSAALILSPEATEPLATRTLLHATLGHLTAARKDVARLSASSPEQAAFLDQYLRIYFPRFAFWPAVETFPLTEDELPLVVARTREEVVEVIQRYATRLGRLREALRQRLAVQRANEEDSEEDNDIAAGFMIPDLTGLLPEGPLPLTRWTFEMSAEEYGGTVGEEEPAAAVGDDDRGRAEDDLPSPVEIAVDETLGVDPLPTAILSILRQARADWSGLVWLSWAVGLDAPGLPQSLQPPPTFGRAAVMTMERVWRCRDKLRTSGLLALTKGIPGFAWEGTTIDELPAALADVVLDEYVEARAVFSWLCDPANRSPWQEDLRTADE